MDVRALQTFHKKIADQPRVLIRKPLRVPKHKVAVHPHVPAVLSQELTKEHTIEFYDNKFARGLAGGGATC